MTSAELDEIRTAAATAMPDTCTIQTRTETATKGSVVVSYVNAYTDVPCRVMPYQREGRETITGEKVSAVARFILTIPYDQPIDAKCRVIHQGVTYDVLGVASEHSFRTARRADLVVVI